jgi:hypothetical protein
VGRCGYDFNQRDGAAMTSIRASKVLWPAIALLALAVANVAAVIANWPVSRSVSADGLMVLSVGVFVGLYMYDRDSLRAPEGRKLVFWSVICVGGLLGAGAGVMASALKTHGVLVSVTCVAVVAMGVGMGRFIEVCLGDRNGEALAEIDNAVS